MSASAPISRDAVARWAEQQNWLTTGLRGSLADVDQGVVQAVWSERGKVRSVLHGDWLHEPLHVVMTDVPVGSWTAAVVFDTIAAVSDSSAIDYAADACVLLARAEP